MTVQVQLDTDYVRSVAGRTVGVVLKERDERDCWEEIAARLDLTHLVDREIQALSGGELQRFAIASSAVRDADCYMFDEASSFLDIKQRMTATELIRSLVFDGAKQDGGVANKYVMVVEHDLAVLDYMCAHARAHAHAHAHAHVHVPVWCMHAVRTACSGARHAAARRTHTRRAHACSIS